VSIQGDPKSESGRQICFRCDLCFVFHLSPATNINSSVRTFQSTPPQLYLFPIWPTYTTWLLTIGVEQPSQLAEDAWWNDVVDQASVTSSFRTISAAHQTDPEIKELFNRARLSSSNLALTCKFEPYNRSHRYQANGLVLTLSDVQIPVAGTNWLEWLWCNGLLPWWMKVCSA
jgi:hypothetical protein